MRAIDADAMIDRLKEWNTKDKTDKALYNFTLNRINEQPTIRPAQPEQLEQCPIYGGMCAYPSDQCYDCPRHAGAKMEVTE